MRACNHARRVYAMLTQFDGDVAEYGLDAL